MARMRRFMMEGLPFHLTHRGNHKRDIFFSDRDRLEYLSLLLDYSRRFRMFVWAYCLMSNHVHVVAVGERVDSIAKGLGNTHREYSRRHNIRREVTGHLWANRFFSSALDEVHLWATVRYVELNPVRAGLVREASDYRWSSARAHVGLQADRLLAPNRPFPGPIGDWKSWLGLGLEEVVASRIRRGTASGEPTGSDEFVRELENRAGRKLRSSQAAPRPGPKRLPQPDITNE